MAAKRRVGRPLKFETPEDLAKAINAYFASMPNEEYTVTGLCLAIGTSRDVLDDYKERDGYKHIVTHAKLIVENSYEMALRKDGGAQNIFPLKNFGWSDKQETMGDSRVIIKLDREAEGFL